jgi:N-acetyl-gamma-glutamyl-phosphate reductase
MKKRVGIAGFRGYSGAELVRILGRHRHVELVLLEHRDDGHRGPVIRRSSGPARVACEAEAVSREGIDLVFLATAADVSMELAPAMLSAGTRVVDLSGAFRLRTPENYTAWYKEPHTQPALLAEAVYGLPEFCRERIPAARLVANPGCYPTAANLALRPLVEAGAIDRAAGVVCDSKSGVSGAGRKPSLKTSFCEVTENFSAYSILRHRHVPEVLQVSGLEESEFSFTAQLLPLDRGILETIYFRPAGRALGPSTAEELLAIYESRYAGEPFVRLYNHGLVPDLRAVARTNFCDIGVVADGPRAVVVSAIDNLVKGAAGQAVQNMNLMLGYPETEGLL